MRLFLLFPILCALLLFGCDPKVNQRQARFNPSDCPSCINGSCVDCKSTGKCTHCDGKGKRITSTKNYTGEGIKLVDYEEICPFCKGTGKCHYCEGSGKCNACDGAGKSSQWEPKSVSESSKSQKAPVATPVTTTPDTTVAPAADTSAKPADTTK